jgi:glucosamine-6-phosphate deaminase
VRLIIKSDYVEISAAAAQIVSDAITAKPQRTLCLAAGNTPTGTYRNLVRLHKTEALDFSSVTFFYLDEYVALPANHPESFRSYLYREFFDHIGVAETNIHAPDANYEETIREHGGIDLLICGIGANGHVAFNEPGSSMDSRTRIVDLAESTIEGFHGKFKPEEVPRRAITMGLATILEARQILLLASGQEKKEILTRAFNGPVTTDVPASTLQRHPNLIVLTDQPIDDASPVQTKTSDS